MALDYYGSYRRFVKSHSVPQSVFPPSKKARKAAKRELGLERHHITPKFLGGRNGGDNIAYLSPMDHVLAHWLLNAALVQRGTEPMPYFPTDMQAVVACRKNLPMEWNPLSKVRIRFECGGFDKTVILSEAVRAVAGMGEMSGLSKGFRRAIRERGNLLPYLLAACARPEKDRCIGAVRVSMVV